MYVWVLKQQRISSKAK